MTKTISYFDNQDQEAKTHRSTNLETLVCVKHACCIDNAQLL